MDTETLQGLVDMNMSVSHAISYQGERSRMLQKLVINGFLKLGMSQTDMAKLLGISVQKFVALRKKGIL